MANGVKFYLKIGGDEINFQSVAFADVIGKIEASQRLNPDGTVNEGFTDAAEDLKTFSCDLTVLMNKDDPTSSPLNLFIGAQDLDWEMGYYDVPLYSGNAFFIERYNYSGNVPGNAPASFHFESRGTYITF